jgi:hypothetical protein
MSGRRHGDGSLGLGGESRDAPQRDPAQRRAETTAERIRREAQGPPCSCSRPGELTGDGRCARCYGRPGDAA